jgi:amino acid transporter
MQGMPGWMKWTIALLIGLAIILVGFRYAGWLLTAFFVMNCLVLIIVVLLSQATTWCAVMFMICAMALVLRTDKFTNQGNSVLEKFSKPAAATPKPAPTTTVPTIPQSTTTPATKPPATTPTPQPKKP